MKHIFLFCAMILFCGSCGFVTDDEVRQYYSEHGFDPDLVGRDYTTIHVGNLEWMTENVRNAMVDHYSANDSETNDYYYGYLYTYDNAQKVCKSPWRLPSQDETMELSRAYNVSELKAITWLGGNNESGFDARPAGSRSSDTHYSGFNSEFYMWTSSAYGSDSHYAFNIDNNTIFHSAFSSGFACSVRCVRDVSQF